MKGVVDSRGRALVTIEIRSTVDGSETSLSAWEARATATFLPPAQRLFQSTLNLLDLLFVPY